MTKTDRFSQWIFHSYHPSAEGLALYRIFTALMFLFFLLPDASYYSDLADFPDDFFTPPPGPMMLFSEFPPAWVFYSIHTLLALSWVGVLVGYKTRFCSLMAAAFMLLLMGFIFSIGKVNHQMLLVLVPAIMAFSNWGAAYSFDSKHSVAELKTEGWPLVLLSLFIGFMFFTAGFPKILGGWLDPDSLATRGHLLNQYFVRGRTELLSGYMVELDLPLVWSFLDWATILFEVGFLVAVLRAGWTRLFVCFAVLFHFSTMLTLNIAFLVNFPAYAAFLPWSNIHRFLEDTFSGNRKESGVALKAGAALFLVFTVIKIVDKTGWVLSLKEPTFSELALIGSAVLIVVAMVIWKVKRWVSET
ncbi:MAG: HTTM domain-containing protein [Bacteroidota bacterium]